MTWLTGTCGSLPTAIAPLVPAPTPEGWVPPHSFLTGCCASWGHASDVPIGDGLWPHPSMALAALILLAGAGCRFLASDIPPTAAPDAFPGKRLAPRRVSPSQYRGWPLRCPPWPMGHPPRCALKAAGKCGEKQAGEKYKRGKEGSHHRPDARGMGCEQGCGAALTLNGGSEGVHSFTGSHDADCGRKKRRRREEESAWSWGDHPAPSFCGSPGKRGGSRSRPRGSPRSTWDPSLPLTLEQPRLDAVPGLFFSRFPPVFPLSEGSGRKQGAAWPSSLRKRGGSAFIGGKRELPAASLGQEHGWAWGGIAPRRGGGRRGTACRRAGASPWGKEIHLPAVGRGQREDIWKGDRRNGCSLWDCPSGQPQPPRASLEGKGFPSPTVG